MGFREPFGNPAKICHGLLDLALSYTDVNCSSQFKSHRYILQKFGSYATKPVFRILSVA
jgi:hypothetical protein